MIAFIFDFDFYHRRALNDYLTIRIIQCSDIEGWHFVSRQQRIVRHRQIRIRWERMAGDHDDDEKTKLAQVELKNMN